MYPSVHQDYGKFSGEGYNPGPMKQPYVPPHYASAPGMPVHSPAATTTPWSTGLCHCFDDPANCLVTSVCPCITFGQISEILNKGTTCKYVNINFSTMILSHLFFSLRGVFLIR